MRAVDGDWDGQYSEPDETDGVDDSCVNDSLIYHPPGGINPPDTDVPRADDPCPGPVEDIAAPPVNSRQDSVAAEVRTNGVGALAVPPVVDPESVGPWLNLGGDGSPDILAAALCPEFASGTGQLDETDGEGQPKPDDEVEEDVDQEAPERPKFGERVSEAVAESFKNTLKAGCIGAAKALAYAHGLGPVAEMVDLGFKAVSVIDALDSTTGLEVEVPFPAGSFDFMMSIRLEGDPADTSLPVGWFIAPADGSLYGAMDIGPAGDQVGSIWPSASEQEADAGQSHSGRSPTDHRGDTETDMPTQIEEGKPIFTADLGFLIEESPHARPDVLKRYARRNLLQPLGSRMDAVDGFSKVYYYDAKRRILAWAGLDDSWLPELWRGGGQEYSVIYGRCTDVPGASWIRGLK